MNDKPGLDLVKVLRLRPHAEMLVALLRHPEKDDLDLFQDWRRQVQKQLEALEAIRDGAQSVTGWMLLK